MEQRKEKAKESKEEVKPRTTTHVDALHVLFGSPSLSELGLPPTAHMGALSASRLRVIVSFMFGRKTHIRTGPVRPTCAADAHRYAPFHRFADGAPFAQ